MPRPKGGYYNAAGVRLPSVTTITGRYKDSSQLLFWAFRQGQQRPQGQLYEESAKAADVGTLAHAMVEARIKGLAKVETTTDDPELIEKARQAFHMYDVWAAQSKLKIIATETDLISEEFQFGGTPDAIGEIDGKLCLLDWKTSNGIYEDHLWQVAAYGRLWEENNPELKLTGGYHILRFGKEHPDFAHRHWLELEDAWLNFKAFRECYERSKALKKRVG